MERSASIRPIRLPRHSSGRPDGLYWWVLGTILLLQGFLVLSRSFRTLVYMSDKLEARLPIALWWTSIDIRAMTWLALAPLLAAVIIDRRSTLWQLGLLHMGLLGVALFVSGNVLHRVAHIQADVRQDLIDQGGVTGTKALRDDTLDEAEHVPSGSKITERFKMKSYADVAFHKSYGLGYWFGEFTLILSAYLMMAAVGYAVLYFRITEYRTRQAERLHSTMVELQHESLCNRLTPHFLFNALNTISSLTLTDGKAARTCISQLGELLRASIEAMPAVEIKLEREFEILEIYLAIQKLRFGDKLVYSFDMEHGLAAASVPAFVLQPLVENSFQHGLPKQDSIARLSVSAKREGAYCRLEVSDNGAKVAPDTLLEERYGMGLTRQRLHLQYGHDAKIFHEPNRPCGLKVIVLVPFHMQKSEPA